jgi:hypothetical protein
VHGVGELLHAGGHVVGVELGREGEVEGVRQAGVGRLWLVERGLGRQYGPR